MKLLNSWTVGSIKPIMLNVTWLVAWYVECGKRVRKCYHVYFVVKRDKQNPYYVIKGEPEVHPLVLKTQINLTRKTKINTKDFQQTSNTFLGENHHFQLTIIIYVCVLSLSRVYDFLLNQYYTMFLFVDINPCCHSFVNNQYFVTSVHSFADFWHYSVIIIRLTDYHCKLLLYCIWKTLEIKWFHILFIEWMHRVSIYNVCLQSSLICYSGVESISRTKRSMVA